MLFSRLLYHIIIMEKRLIKKAQTTNESELKTSKFNAPKMKCVTIDSVSKEWVALHSVFNKWVTLDSISNEWVVMFKSLRTTDLIF